MSKKNIFNINSKVKDKNINVKANGGYYELNFYKDKNSFTNPKTFEKFIKSVEKIVRTDPEGIYKSYIGYLKGDIGLNHCMVLKNITDEKADIEMHHGPVFGLYDICAIITDHLLAHDKKISTFKVAQIVLKEHTLNNIQVVMLSKTMHEAFHAGKIFIHPSQAFGNLEKFVEKYKDGLSIYHWNQLESFYNLLEKNDSTENDLFKFQRMLSWNKTNK